ncbi:hypothetical protein [Catenulispora subtropica]
MTEAGLSVSVVIGGVCPAANHMTIVDCSGEIVRAGVVHERAIEAALGR